MTGSDEEFGESLRRRRLAAGLTLGAFATVVHYSKSHLSKVERGLKPPSRDLARLCDSALRAEGALSALAERARVVADWRSSSAPVVVSAIGRQLSAGALPLLEGSQALLSELRRLGQRTHSELVLPALVAHASSLESAAAQAGAARGRPLLRLASRYAEYAGWLLQETGSDSAALSWTDRAVQLAASGGDPHLAAYALVRQGLVALYRDDAQATIGLARRAQQSWLPPRIRGLALQREAQGHALAGDYTHCMRALDAARPLLAERGSEPPGPTLGSMHLPDPVPVITGWCLHDLGRPRSAAAVLDRELAALPLHALRTRARYGARRALAHAVAGEIDHAAELVTELLDTTEVVGSATIASDLAQLARVMARHHRRPAVRAVAPRLAFAARRSYAG